MELVEITSWKQAKPGLEPARIAEGRRHPVVAELDMTLFRGARCWAVYEGETITHIHASKFGKRKKNKWEPYWNWYIAYTHPDYRRQGLAKEVSVQVQEMAVEAGCVRLKSLAGTFGGLRLHMSRGDQLWGYDERGEVVVDTPLVDGDWSGTPPNALTPKRLNLREAQAIKALKYDKEFSHGA
jgi:GNAT superfamily N-acetyltransferase